MTCCGSPGTRLLGLTRRLPPCAVRQTEGSRSLCVAQMMKENLCLFRSNEKQQSRQRRPTGPLEDKSLWLESSVRPRPLNCKRNNRLRSINFTSSRKAETDISAEIPVWFQETGHRGDVYHTWQRDNQGLKGPHHWLNINYTTWNASIFTCVYAKKHNLKCTHTQTNTNTLHISSNSSSTAGNCPLMTFYPAFQNPTAII